MLFFPCVDPLVDSDNICLKILSAFALELHNDLCWVGRPGFIKDNLHDLGFIIFLDFLQRIASNRVDAELV
jgi:hypothetical protein